MHLRNTSSRYGLIARSLHWVIVAGIVGQYLLAEAHEDESGATGVMTALDWHMSIGIALLALALVRVAWRTASATPEWPSSMGRFERRLAEAGHIALYGLLFAIPISGWMLASVEGQPVRLFGWFELPAWMPAGTAEREDLIQEVHEILFNILFALAIVHVLAAVKHQFIDRDDVLKRMLTGRR